MWGVTMAQSLKSKMISYFMLVVIISGVGFGLVWGQLKTLSEVERTFFEVNLVNYSAANTLNYNSLSQVADVRGYLIYEKQELLDHFKDVNSKNVALIDQLISETNDEKSKTLLESIKKLDGMYYKNTLEVLVPLIQKDDLQGAKNYAAQTLGPIGKELVVQVVAYQAIQDKAVEEASLAMQQTNASAQKQIILFALGSLIAGIAIGLYAAQSISKPIQLLVGSAQKIASGNLVEEIHIERNDEIGVLALSFNQMRQSLRTLVGKVIEEANQVAATSEELTAGSEQSALAAGQVAESVTELARSTEVQMKATNDVSRVVQDLSGSAQEVSANAHQVAEQALQAAQESNSGIKAIEDTIYQIGKIKETVGQASDIVLKLGERSKEVDSIVDAISSIADQTNLLALNAAIEAARAGEQGRGFSVVAEEVRKLAEQSQESTKKIALITSIIQEETQLAVSSMRAGTEQVAQGEAVVQIAGTSFNTISTLINNVSSQVADISEAIEQMANGNQEIVGAVVDMENTGRHTADEAQNISASTEEQLAAMEEITAASQTLSRMAEELKDIVGQFIV